jgi:hypothetical protein
MDFGGYCCSRYLECFIIRLRKHRLWRRTKMGETHKQYGKFFVLVLIFTMFVFGCDSRPPGLDSKQVSTGSKEECSEPQNPYNDGGGHDAGFNWAKENGGGCSGQSTSFNEGCEEYHRQLGRYNECAAKK